MAVIQISKIQIRRGQTAEQGMPQLASGEMGWSVDEQRLFIGNGSVAEGAPAVGNTEILTEERMFDLLSTGKFTATNYTYAGHGITATITGVLGPNVPVVRTLQHKLDDNVSTLDFGATDSTDCTAKFQKAIDEIYLRSFDKSLPKSRIPVRIPAGVYYTTATIYLPPFVALIGDGIDKTIIRSISAGNTTIFATIDGDSTPTNRITGTNILSTNQPRQIRISGMTLEQTGTILTTQTTPIVQLDYARDTVLSEVKFKGNYQAGNTVTNSNSAIELGFNTSDLTIERCQFEQLSYPIVSNWNVEDIAIIENTFQDLYMGITLAQSLLPEVSSRNIGPNRVSIRDNKFIDISRQAIFAGVNTSTNNQINSENNTFINVGNNLNGDAEPASPIITFGSHGNSSTNDNFERLWFMQTRELDTPQFEVIEGTALVRLKFTDRQLIEESTVTQTLIRIPYASTITSVSMDYTIEKTGIARKGTLSVVASDAGISFKDSYAVAGSSDGDTVFSADFLDHGPVDINDTLAVQYTNPVAAGTGTIIFNVSYYR
jgi:hypothetical protein